MLLAWIPFGLAHELTDAPLYGKFTPEAEIITRPDQAGTYVSFRAERREVNLWGRTMAVLLYSGPLASGQQREVNDGRYSLITVPRDPSREVLFLSREVWPSIMAPFLDVGGFKGLAPGQVLPPEDPRLKILERNLLRAAWHQRYSDLGWLSFGRGRWMDDGAAVRLLVNRMIEEAERNGFLHECQHALDEAYKVYPETYHNPVPNPAEAELRAMLASLAHSQTPHYALYDMVRQYQERLPPYAQAAKVLFAGLAAQILQEAGDVPRLRPGKNVMLQLPRIDTAVLRRLAAQVMAQRYRESDRGAGYRLDYTAIQGGTGGLRVGLLRGKVAPDDLPAAQEGRAVDGTMAGWRFKEERVHSSGVHVYLSSEGVRMAQAGPYGLALGIGGYLAAHFRAPATPGPWILEISGGVLRENEIEGRQMPVRVIIGNGETVPLSREASGRFRATIAPGAVAGGMLRVVIRRKDGDGPPAFLTGFRLLEAPKS
ncbi:MAG: hypothetical protein ACE5HD_12815 [Acidobacteriota bacterium]